MYQHQLIFNVFQVSVLLDISRALSRLYCFIIQYSVDIYATIQSSLNSNQVILLLVYVNFNFCVHHRLVVVKHLYQGKNVTAVSELVREKAAQAMQQTLGIENYILDIVIDDMSGASPAKKQRVV